jgi:hypothetical protein
MLIISWKTLNIGGFVLGISSLFKVLKVEN